MTNIGGEGIGLWDEEDQFFYDVLNLPDGAIIPLKVRSMVGLIPLFAVETLEPELLDELPEFSERLEWFLKYRPDLAQLVSRWQEPGLGERRLLSLLRGHRMKMLLTPHARRDRVPLGLRRARALASIHEASPYVFDLAGGKPRGAATSRRNRTAACSAATPTGAGRSGSRSTTC